MCQLYTFHNFPNCKMIFLKSSLIPIWFPQFGLMKVLYHSDTMFFCGLHKFILNYQLGNRTNIHMCTHTHTHTQESIFFFFFSFSINKFRFGNFEYQPALETTETVSCPSIYLTYLSIILLSLL